MKKVQIRMDLDKLSKLLGEKHTRYNDKDKKITGWNKKIVNKELSHKFRCDKKH